MNMRTTFQIRTFRQAGSALLLTLTMSAIALLTVAGVLAYAAANARLTYRSNQYSCSVAAAEAATEKVVSQISRDYLNGGEAMVLANVSAYQQLIPTSTDSSYWTNWEFADGTGQIGRSFVQVGSSSGYTVLNSTYAGLKGYATTCTIVSDARQTGMPQEVIGAVLQELQLARIPIFQFMMYTTGSMEISCGQPFTITGRVHSNGQLFIEPDNVMTFQSDVTSVGNILFQRNPLDTRSAPSGSVVYQARKDAQVAAMTLPIGMTNSPEAVREIIQPPPANESPGSALGRLRYYNLADMLLVVTNAGSNTLVSGSYGTVSGIPSLIPSNEVSLFVRTTNSFWDEREGRTVKPVDLDVAALKQWSATNQNLRPALGGQDVASVYVWDRRTVAGTNLGAVRVENGTQLPSRGLTVATASPLYVSGHYNQANASNLGTADTSTTLPASLVGDSITILSPNWTDANSRALLSSRVAAPTTVNAAILAGAVETVHAKYGGGMENFPRFLETWGLANPFTYNGALVKLFPSLYATNSWGKTNVYDPPKRDWAFDTNFLNPSKLPPLTPSLQKVVRGQWATVPPNQTSVTAN